jgi:hypothetical protein
MAGKVPKEGDYGKLPDGSRVIYLDGAPRKVNEGGLADMGGGYFKSPQGKTFRAGPKGGFQQIGGPSQTQIDGYAQKGVKINEALGSLDMFDKKLRETKVTGPFGWATNPNDLAEAKQLADDLMLRLKEQPYNLGVLNGPDLQILQAVIADPTTIKDAAFRKSVTPRLRNIAAKLGDTYRNEAQSFQDIGGGPGVVKNLFQPEDSTYTKEEWGGRGLVPSAKAPVRRGDAPRTQPRAAAGTAKKQPFKGQYGTVYED